jgi:hypothetical protein
MNTSSVAEPVTICTTLKFLSDIQAKYSSHFTPVAVYTNYVTSKWFNYNCKSDSCTEQVKQSGMRYTLISNSRFGRCNY